jgi:hypothetical protein
MKSATRWLSVSVVVTWGLVAAGVLISGCSPAKTPPSGPGGVSAPAPPAAQPATQPEEKTGEPTAAKEPATAEPKPAEPKPAEPKPAEPKATEPKPAEPAKPEETPKPAEPAPQATSLDLAPPVSTFAPAADLVAQVGKYVKEFEEAVENEENYKEAVELETLSKYSNTFILIALALGLHDTDNQYKAAAPAMLKAAQQLAAASDYAAAKAAVEAVKAATASTDGDPAQLKWEKVASMKPLMKAVSPISTRLKRPLRSESRAKKAVDDMAGYAAVLAVIGQGSLPDCGETDKPNEVGQWQAFCVDLRDKAAAANAAVRKFEQEGTPESFEALGNAIKVTLQQSCENCHAVFKPDAVMPTDEQ